MKISSEAKIGIIVTLAIAVTIWGLNFLKGRNILKMVNEYYAVYENIDGLEINSKIFMRGYRVGQISDLIFDPETKGKVVVVLGIYKDYKIPENSVSELFDSDIMGTKAIRIILSDYENYYSYGDTLITTTRSGITEQLEKELLPVKDKAEALISSIDTFMQNLNYIFNEETGRMLQESIKNLENTTAEIDKLLSEQGKLTRIISHIESITENLKNNNEEITSAMRNISSITDSIAKSDLKATINKANNTLEQTHIILDKINKGEGTIGMLVNNDTLYHNLEATARDLDILLIDLKENPQKYIHVSVFGKSEKKKK